MNIQAMRDELAHHLKNIRIHWEHRPKTGSYMAGYAQGMRFNIENIQRHTRPERFNKGGE